MSQIPEDLQHDYEIAKQLIRQGATHGAFEKMLIERIAQLQAERDALQQTLARFQSEKPELGDLSFREQLRSQLITNLLRANEGLVREVERLKSIVASFQNRVPDDKDYYGWPAS